MTSSDYRTYSNLERQLKSYIWGRDNRKCRRCHRTVYQTYKMPSQGVIHHVNRDPSNNSDVNLILVCYDCLHELSRLYLEYPAKYICQMELITQTKLQPLRDTIPKYDIGYRYQKVSRYIEDLEYENNMLVLPSIDQEQLKRLKALKVKIEAAENKRGDRMTQIWICKKCKEYYGLLDDGNREPCRRFGTPLPEGTLYCRAYRGSKLHHLRCWYQRCKQSREGERVLRGKK